MKFRIEKAFTLVELLVVIAILGILSVIGLTAFSTSQIRSRDATRKSDLKQIASALELYYNDYNTYPSSSNGRILGCPSNSSTACGWGEDQFTDGKTVYLKVVPSDPASDLNYYYKTVAINGVNNQGFQLFAMLENTRDTYACIGNDCGSHSDLPPEVSCGGSSSCNFSITSPNTTFDVE